MTNDTCSYENCARKRESAVYCGAHYRRNLKGLPMDALIQVRRKRQVAPEDGLCTMPLCSKPFHAVGYCSAHYARLLRGNSRDEPLRSSPGTARPVCSILFCNFEADATVHGSVCAAHRTMMGRHGRSHAVITRPFRFAECTISLCHKPYFSSGMCVRHNTRAYSYRLSAMQLDMILRETQCQACGCDVTEDTMHIDHDHICCVQANTCGNCVRGVLCAGCNIGLGAFGDSIDKLISAAEFLERHSAPGKVALKAA